MPRLRTVNTRRKNKLFQQFNKYAPYWRRHARNSVGLKVGAYCIGCRGHPGIVTKVSWGYNPFDSDFEVKSLVDGIEESCSVYHCGFYPYPKVLMEAYAEEIQSLGKKIALIKFFPNAYKSWEEQWVNPMHENPHKSNCNTLQEYLMLDDKEFAIYLAHRDI